MAIKDFFGGLTGMFAGKTAKDISLEDLSRQLSALRREEAELRREDAELEAREKQLLAEGREASSPVTRAALAGKIRDDREQRKTLAQRQGILAKPIRICRALHTLKENEAFYKRIGLGKALMGVPVEKIILYIEQAPEGIEADIERMGDILGSLDDASALIDETLGSAESTGDAELDSIMAEFDADPVAEKPASTADDDIFPAEKKTEGEKEKKDGTVQI